MNIDTYRRISQGVEDLGGADWDLVVKVRKHLVEIDTRLSHLSQMCFPFTREDGEWVVVTEDGMNEMLQCTKYDSDLFNVLYRVLDMNDQASFMLCLS